MRDLSGRVAAVTGAASGIGRALALALAREGCQLALSDIDDAGLEETGQQAATLGAEPSLAHVDVADRDAVFTWADRVVSDHGSADLVFNNAGVALAATVRHMTLEELEWLFAINFWGVVYGTKAFHPHLERAGRGHIVNVSSVFGLVAFPGNGAYSAAKFAVRGFSEALSIELQADRSPVLVSTVHPGGIRTGIARHARVGANEPGSIAPEERETLFFRAARTTADRAARVILEGVKRDKRRILITPGARVISAVQRLFPSLYQSAFARGARGRQPGQV